MRDYLLRITIMAAVIMALVTSMGTAHAYMS
jgi:hypothetical protein